MVKPKVLVAVPGFAGIQPESQESYVRMMFRAGRDLPDYEFAFVVVTKREQFRARNHIIDNALAGGFEYVLMLDDDHVVPHDILPRMMAHFEEHPEYGVLGALYYQRGGAFHPVIMRRKSTEKEVWDFEWYSPCDPIMLNPGLHEVDIIGGGCMFFRTDVFRKLMPPYFWWEYSYGTDISICSRLKDAGVRIAVDTSIELGHLGNKTIITSRTIGATQQRIAQINFSLRDDVREYLGLSPLELDSEMIKAAESATARAEKWHQSVKDSSSWADIRQYYQDHGSWHIANLLYFNMQPDRFKELAIKLLDGKVSRGDTVLDYGPGIGHLTIPFLQAGCYVDTVEVDGAPTLDFINWRAGRHGGTALLRHHLLSDIELPDNFKDGRPYGYKAAFLISVIDHLGSPYETIKWITRNMAIGGYLICDYLAVGSDENNPQHLDRIDVHTFDNFMHHWGWETSPEDMCMFIYRGK